MKQALSIYTTELKYYRDVFIMALLMLFSAGTFAAFFTDQWPWAMLGLGQIAYIIGAISIGIRMEREKRERTARLLPLPPAVYGVIRLLVFVTYHLLITSIIFLASLIRGLQWLHVLDLLALFAFNMVITAIFILNDDIFYAWGWWARNALWFFILLVAIYSALTTSGLIFIISPDQPKSPVDVATLSIAWLGLMSFDVWIYMRRKSYLK